MKQALFVLPILAIAVFTSTPVFAGSVSGSKSCEKLALEDVAKLEKAKPEFCRSYNPVTSRKTLANIKYVVVIASGGSSYNCGQSDEYYYKIDSEGDGSCSLSWPE